MKTEHVIKINAHGGLFTPNKLNLIATTAALHGAQNINFGPRQEIFFNISRENMSAFEIDFKKLELDYELDTDTYPNITSSYAAEGILSWENWLTEGVYKDVLYMYDYKPRLKINICDNEQSLMPLFNSELNFISSATPHYWHLYINLTTDTNLYAWDRLIYTTDIAKVSREIEELYYHNKITIVSEINKIVNENLSYLFIDTTILELKRYSFQYYEGMNRYGDKYWLGIYRRNYLFPISFVSEFCELCKDTHIAQICITTWRTLIVKGLQQQHRINWEKLLGKHGVNLRHSANELNWVVADINSRELDIKQSILSFFDLKDTRTFGLVFGIKLYAHANIQASVIIEKRSAFIEAYDIYYTKDFNPNNPEKILFHKDVSKHKLPYILLSLCKLYYSQLNDAVQPINIEQQTTAKVNTPSGLHQCMSCYTIYDPSFGDSTMNIPPNTPFDKLPYTYMCPTCEAPRNTFVQVSSFDMPAVSA
ncbi:MAG: rubredoxin [Cytophagales bacterium]|nr:rubredoxin [Cytophagales bacterium]